MKLLEKNIDELEQICFTGGSTHILKTCKIDNEKYYLKFSEEELFFGTETNPSLQILVEYLAYQIYSLYPEVAIPANIHLIFDTRNNKVGLATSEVQGKSARSINNKTLGKHMSAGIFVDLLLANWDVIGLSKDNVMVSPKNDKVTRIDPGGALTFRGMGDKKGDRFSNNPSELQTMLDPNFGGAGVVLQYSDIKHAANVFSNVSWSQTQQKLRQVNQYITSELSKSSDFKDLLSQWNSEFQEITGKLINRHKTISLHVSKILKENKYINSTINLLLEKEIGSSFNKPSYKPLKKIDEPSGGPFGNILFSPSRTDGVDTSEENTSEEDEILRAFSSHINDSNSAPLSRNIELVLSLINQGKYDLLKPINGYVYRVMTFPISSEDNLRKFGISSDEIIKFANSKPWVIENKLTITPLDSQYGFMSWTYNLSELKNNNIIRLLENQVMIIVRAKIPGSGTFIMSPYMTQNVSYFTEYSKERETISYGDIVIDKMLVYYESRKLSHDVGNNINKQIRQVVSVIAKSYNDNINKVLQDCDKIIINYLNTLEAFNHKPLKSFDQIKKEYKIIDSTMLINFIHSSKQYFSDEIIDIEKNIKNIFIDCEGKLELFGEKYVNAISENLSKRNVIVSPGMYSVFFRPKKINNHNIVFKDNIEHMFFGNRGALDIEEIIGYISKGTAPHETNSKIKKELKSTRDILFRLFQNEK